MKNLYDIAEIALKEAFEAGRWRGQVDLEEFYDLEQYGTALMELFIAERTTSPVYEASLNSKLVQVCLRSDKWRDGVKKSTKEYFEIAKKLLFEEIAKIDALQK